MHILDDNVCETISLPSTTIWIGSWCIDCYHVHQWCRLAYSGPTSSCPDERYDDGSSSGGDEIDWDNDNDEDDDIDGDIDNVYGNDI